METPCISVCTMHTGLGVCEGCGRTLAEIAGWARMSPDERRTIMATLPERRRRLNIEERG